MVRYYCRQGCGQNYCTSDRSPTLPHIVGMGQGCPKHGTSYDHTIGVPTTTRVCRKCGLLNNISATKQSPKFNGGVYAIKCIDCNKPTIDLGEQPANIYYCIRCGRCYDGRYATKNSSGGVVIKCRHCGGATSTVFFITT